MPNELESKPPPSLRALEALVLQNTTLRLRLTALQLLAKRAMTGSDLERQLAGSLLVRMAAQDIDASGGRR